MQSPCSCFIQITHLAGSHLGTYIWSGRFSQVQLGYCWVTAGLLLGYCWVTAGLLLGSAGFSRVQLGLTYINYAQKLTTRLPLTALLTIQANLLNRCCEHYHITSVPQFVVQFDVFLSNFINTVANMRPVQVGFKPGF